VLDVLLTEEDFDGCPIAMKMARTAATVRIHQAEDFFNLYDGGGV
jgi:hypothetical protein